MASRGNSRPEFQVIIMAGGRGSRMYPLTTEVPKSLLPIANRPMISYQLELLERVGFSNVIIITHEKAASDLKNFVDEIYEGKISVVWVLLEEFMGTAEALIKAKDKIKSDFIVISSDLVTDETFFHKMVDFHRENDSTATLLLHHPIIADKEQAALAKQQRLEYGLMDYIGIGESNRLLYMASAADVEGNMFISKPLLRRYPNITVYTNMIDAHLYIFSKSVLDLFLIPKTLPTIDPSKTDKSKDATPTVEPILSIKGELLPLLVKAQFSKAYNEDSKTQLSQKLAYGMSLNKRNLNDKIKCYAFVKETGYSTRANTTKSYLQMNIEMASRGSCYTPWEPMVKNYYIHPAAQVDPKTQIGAECVVGQGSVIGARCSVKKSIIGKHCKIDERVKIMNSVIMNHVTINGDCVISGSVICNNVYMKEGCTIKDSFVGAAYTVPDKTEIKGETLCQNKGMTML